jgi:hypothetical protein
MSMSSLAYGALTRKRAEAPKGKSTETAPPGVKTYVDALAALVPAEVLALHAFMVEVTTDTKKVGDRAVTTITDPGALEATFWVCIVIATLLFAVGRAVAKPERWRGLDFARAAVPPAAFVLWCILQKSTAWDAISPDTLTEGTRTLIGASGAIVLGALVAWMGALLDGSEPNA